MLKIGPTQLVKIICSSKLYQMILASLFVASFSVQAHEISDKDPQVAWSKIDNGAIIIDVRTAEEFNYDHLKSAINIPFELIVRGVQKHGIDKSKPIVVYCRSGRRSGIAYEELTKAGYLDVYNGGGLVNLKQYRAMHTDK